MHTNKHRSTRVNFCVHLSKSVFIWLVICLNVTCSDLEATKGVNRVQIDC